MPYLRLMTYVLPVLLGYNTRKFFGMYFIYYTHVLILISIGLSWYFVIDFPWGITTPLLGIFAAACLVSFVATRHWVYAVSAVIQEMCILSAAAITSTYGYVVIVLLFSLMHPTWFVKIATLFLGSASIYLFITYQTVLLSFTLHVITLTILMYSRDKLQLGYEYHPLPE